MGRVRTAMCLSVGKNKGREVYLRCLLITSKLSYICIVCSYVYYVLGPSLVQAHFFPSIHSMQFKLLHEFSPFATRLCKRAVGSLRVKKSRVFDVVHGSIQTFKSLSTLMISER